MMVPPRTKVDGITVKPLESQDLQRAGELYAGSCRKLKEKVPHLPGHNTDPTGIARNLHGLHSGTPIVSAWYKGGLVGYLGGLLLESFKGGRGAYSPEWANALDDSLEQGVAWAVWEAMYARISAEWVSDGRFIHGVTVPAHQDTIINGMFWQGFGMVCIDAVRGLDPIEPHTRELPSGLHISRGAEGDSEAIAILEGELQSRLAAAPTFLDCCTPHGSRLQGVMSSIRDPENCWLIAEDQGKILGYIKIGPSNPRASRMAGAPDTAAISGAITTVGADGSGIGRALLGAAVTWAAENGYQRVAVDFESANTQGRNFWLKYFEPICYSIIRTIPAM